MQLHCGDDSVSHSIYAGSMGLQRPVKLANHNYARPRLTPNLTVYFTVELNVPYPSTILLCHFDWIKWQESSP